MDRGKSVQGRGGKSKTPQYPADLFALGAKSSGEGKRSSSTVHSKPGSSSHSVSGTDRKRESVSASIVPSKKAKLSSSGTASSSSSSRSSTTSNADAWETLAVDVDPADFVHHLKEADTNDETDKVIGLLCGSIRAIRSQKIKPDNVFCNGILFLAKTRPLIFATDCVTAALCSLLRKEPAHTFKIKNPAACMVAGSVLYRAHQDVKRWPEVFVKLWVEDSIGERLWVDLEDCKGLVENIVCGLSTKQPPSLETDGLIIRMESTSTDEDLLPLPDLMRDNLDLIVYPRYTHCMETVESTILDAVREQLNRRQSLDNITRNFLKFLSSTCGLVEVRVMVAPRLEVWLQNPKLTRPAQELLMSLCVNCTGHTQRDVEVISALVKIRLKTKNLINYYLAGIRELISAHSDNLATVLKHTIYNELSTSRNPNNMPMINVMFQYSPDQSAALLADIFQELLLNRDDYLRPLRSLLREIWRVLKAELNLPALCRGLMSQTEPLPRDCENNHRAFAAITDLITLCIFLPVAHHARQDKKDPAQLEKMQTTIAGIQSDAIWWLQETALRVYRPNSTDFVHAIHKVLLMEPAEQYYKTDMWPQEQDRTLFLRLASEVPLEQTTLLRVLLIGLSKEHPLSAPDALELADQLVKRAAAIPSSDKFPVLKVDKLDLMELVFNLCAYHYPENIDLPTGYTPPTLAITNLYWKGWILLLILAAHNPSTFGAVAWEKYPTLRVLMEMCITNHFLFPPSPEELQLVAVEKQAILQFETHLAAASTKMAITQQTSLLLSQLMSMEPVGPARNPSQAVLDQLKSLNSTLRLGHLLCRSRHPDFLLDIIQRQGASQSMPWLADLVHSSDGSLSHLPVQCLCEFLLSSNAVSKQQQKYQQLLSHLQGILSDPQQDAVIICEILDYFLRRLSSSHNRTQAINGLKLLLSSVNDEEPMETDRALEQKDDSSWLLKQLPLLPHFKIAKSQVILALRSACQVENDPALVTAYLCFLARHALLDISDMTDLVVDMAQLIVERSTIMAAILPLQNEPNIGLDAFISIFYSYLNKAREPRREAYTWSESQDQVIATWPSGEDCTLHILVVHAMVILLTYGPLAVTRHNEYEYILDAWFPAEKEAAPKAFLVDTSEEALLIPDWLKLRMIRSQVPRLVEAALTDLEPPQLILFIQSFGIPVASMSKLLETLDRAVVEDKDAVGEAVMDKTYMVQLVDVQHRRGATGGKTFARVLGLQEPPRPPDVQIPSLPICPDLKPLICTKPCSLGEAEAVAALEQIFLSSEHVAEEKLASRELFQSLQRTLAFELSNKMNSSSGNRVCRAVFIYLLKKTTSDKTFVKALLSKSNYSSSLFRLLTTVHTKDLNTTLAVICSAILREATNQSNIFTGILKNFIKRNERKEIKMIDPITMQDPVKVLGNSPVFLLEHRGKKILDAQTNKTMMVTALGTILTKELRPKLSESYATGLLIDWLIQIEPEIIGSSTDLQIRMMFSRERDKGLAAVQTCRPYLLTLLTHQASWATLYRCTSSLLNSTSILKCDPTAVLDFLCALTCNPKLWQGRDKYTPKHRQAEDILGLTMQQVLYVADYIVEEAMELEEMRDAVDRMNNRILLLSQCIGEDEISFMTALVRHLNEIAESSTGKKTEMCKQLLIQLYLRVPSLISQVTDVDLDKYLDSSLVSVSVNSVLDKISHTILTALAATPHAKDWARRSQELELAARKMADTHPLLVLRQLKMLAASLHGRVHLEFGVFRSRSHLALFQHVLGLLELLQPQLFKEEHTDSFHNILNSYFSLFKIHGHVKEVGQLLNRMVVLLQNYISHDANRALTYLQSQSSLISELQSQHANLGSLCIMMSGVQGSGEVVVAMPPSNQQNTAQGHDIANLLQSEDALTALQDLDTQSVRRPAILEPALGSLCRLLASRSSAIRGLAHGLLARYLRFAPHAARYALPAYLSCLDSPHTEVISTALERLPEMAVCSQELALPLLKKVFAVGLSLNMNTTNCITKTIALLNLQSGC